MTLCGSSLLCGCAFVSDTLSISGDGTGDNPLRIEGAFPTIATSSSRPLSPFHGQVVYETNTRQFVVWKTPPGVWVYQLSGARVRDNSHSATGSATTGVTFASQTTDRGGYWASGSQVEVPEGLTGLHVISAQTFTTSGVNWNANSHIRLVASGTNGALGRAASASDYMSCSAVANLNEFETVSCEIFNAGATVNCDVTVDVFRIQW